jgi:hypothetical protein
MLPPIRLFTLVSLALLTACSTPDSRIAVKRTAFEQFPADVQQKIRAGQIDVGFTDEMVLMALGEPARKFTRKTEAGDTEVWGYHDNKPRFSFGIGVGSGGRHSAVGGGVEMSTGGYDPDEKVRVEFRGGRVTAVDYLKR